MPARAESLAPRFVITVGSARVWIVDRLTDETLKEYSREQYEDGYRETAEGICRMLNESAP